MEIFGRELSLEQMVGLVECHATHGGDLVHRAALEIIAALRESQRRERAAVEDLEGLIELACQNEMDGTCHFCKDNGENCTGTTGWRGPQAALQEGAGHE